MGNPTRLVMDHGDTVSIAPLDGEIMFMIDVKYTDTGMRITVFPLHLEGSDNLDSEAVNIDARGFSGQD